ncbi:hypothetical protein RDABS01_018026 [Bienertia sinuspersici]
MLRKLKLSTINTRLISDESQVFRRFCTAKKSPTTHRDIKKHTLYTTLSTLWSTGQKVSDALDQLSNNGSKYVSKYDLFDCIKKFRKFGRYQHCLEILEWMEKVKIGSANRDLYLNLICKVKGIDEAEKYFDSLPPNAKKGSTYGSLLNCYCSEKMTEKALALFEKMDEMNYANNNMAFTNLMCLYVKVNQPEKVPPLVEEMKRRNIPIGLVSYMTWIQSYACFNDLKGIERVMDEVKKQESVKNEWKLYSSFASAYIKAGQYAKADSSLKRVEEILDNLNNPDRIAYDHLISLYASVGDLKSVTTAWVKLKSKCKGCNNKSYLTMLHSLSKLGDIEHLKKCFKEWNFRYKSYDVRIPTVVIGAYLKHEMIQEAELLLKDAKDRSEQKIWVAHALFVDYYLGKCKIDSALRHFKLALANEWKPPAEKIDKFFEYFIEAKDVDGAENFFQMLDKGQSLSSNACLRLLQTYAAAGKTAPEMHQLMVQHGADTGTEHEKLLEKIGYSKEDNIL